MQNELFRKIPKVDELLAQDGLVLAGEEWGRACVLTAARRVLDALRESIFSGETQSVPGIEVVTGLVLEEARRSRIPSLRRVINATGILLHTNLGRAPLAERAVQSAAEVARGYSTLEYNTKAGERGSRHDHVAKLLCALTGAEDAMVVNNNAAAVLLMLAALAKGAEVVVSRGELVEIGGSFRIPDIMALSGAILREVGTTNRTHPSDYESAIGQETGALLKAHSSNYRIIGFTRDVSLEEMVAIGKERGIPVLYDLGGGYLLPMEGMLAPDEPCVADYVKMGVDILCFSGDKLLGGPQAGILLGGAKYIGRLKKHPLARALRVDKMTLAALEATLSLYWDPKCAQKEIPVLRMLRDPLDSLWAKAERLAAMLDFSKWAPTVVEEKGQIGGGTAPALDLRSAAVAIAPKAHGVDWLESILRGHEPPIIGRIAKDRLLLDVRTLDESCFREIAACLNGIEEAKA